MAIIINLVLSALAVGIAAYLTPGVTVGSPWDALVVAVVLALVNATVGYLLRVVAIPVNILTLGLVSFLIGILMIYLTDALVPGFSVANFWAAIIFAVLLALVSAVLGVRKPGA
jgi:putative membrane protein